MPKTNDTLAATAGRIARLAASALEAELGGEPGDRRDTKSARDLSAILKDVLALRRELSAEESRRGVTVRFEGGAAEAAE